MKVSALPRAAQGVDRPAPRRGTPGLVARAAAQREENSGVPHTLLALFELEGSAPDPADTIPFIGAPFIAPHTLRIVADSTDRVAWMRARNQGITATDVAKLATPKSVQNAAFDKMNRSNFGGNTFTDHGRAREPVIADWVLKNYGIQPSTNLFHAADAPRHLATPDGVGPGTAGTLELCEIKTTSKAWRSIPRNYLRQVWWQQYVLGADRTLLVWEQHENFVPVGDEPEYRWIERDEDQIAILVGFANDLIEILNRQATERAARRGVPHRAPEGDRHGGPDDPYHDR